MKKISITIILFFTVSSFTSFSAGEISEHSISWAYEKLRPHIENDYWFNNPFVTNIISASSLNMYSVPEIQYYYNFIWNENEVLSTYWGITFVDSITHTTKSLLSILTTPSPGICCNIDIASAPTVWQHSSFHFDFSFSTTDTLNIDTCEIRLSEFITTIKQDEELFAKLEFATTDTTNQYFAFGIGYIETLGSKDAFAEYGIDKTRPICFVATSSRHENKWDFCYSYADEEITELTCHSTVGIYDYAPTHTNLFPNPSHNFVAIEFELATYSENVTIKIMDGLGRILLTPIENKTYDSGVHTEQINVKGFENGYYYMLIQTQNKSFVQPFIVIK